MWGACAWRRVSITYSPCQAESTSAGGKKCAGVRAEPRLIAMNMQRRALLCLAVPAVALGAGRARAFREVPAGEAIGRDWAQRCRAQPVAAGAGPVAICPFCGCPVVGARDHGEGGPRLR